MKFITAALCLASVSALAAPKKGKGKVSAPKVSI